MHRRAFTLIELLVVISIIGLLSSVVLASLNAAREKGRLGAARSFEAQAYHIAGEQAIGIWDFDECTVGPAKDRSGFGFDGALMSGATYSPDTPTGQGCSLSLDGVDDYVNVPDPNGIFSFTDLAPMTLSFWLRQKSPDPAAHYGRVMSKESTVGGRQGWDILWGNTTNLSFERWRDGAANISAPPFSADDMWHQVVYSFDGSKVTIYKDGKVVGSGVVSLLLVNHAGPLRFGASSNGGSNNPLSLMDSIRIYAKSLTASEVGTLYAVEKGINTVAYE